MKKRTECEEREKVESGARAKLEPHFILDLGFLFFFNLLVAPTTIFPLVTAYTGAHNPFVVVTAYIGAHNFVLIPLTT
jgi:hypothetical protein